MRWLKNKRSLIGHGEELDRSKYFIVLSVGQHTYGVQAEHWLARFLSMFFSTTLIRSTVCFSVTDFFFFLNSK